MAVEYILRLYLSEGMLSFQLKGFDESMAKLQEDVDSQDAKAKESKVCT